MRISPRHPILSRRSSESTSYVLAALRALHVATFLDGGMSAVRREAVERRETPWFTAEHQSLRVNRTGAGPKNSMSWRQTVQTDSASQDTGKRPLAPLLVARRDADSLHVRRLEGELRDLRHEFGRLEPH